MKITFTTKKESKKLQQEEFLKLSGGERIIPFLALNASILKLPQSKNTPKNKESSNNFVI